MLFSSWFFKLWIEIKNKTKVKWFEMKKLEFVIYESNYDRGKKILI